MLVKLQFIRMLLGPASCVTVHSCALLDLVRVHAMLPSHVARHAEAHHHEPTGDVLQGAMLRLTRVRVRVAGVPPALAAFLTPREDHGEKIDVLDMVVVEGVH